MTVTALPRDRRILRTLAVAAVIAVWLLATLPPQAGLAAAPDVREITPTGITIDGSSADWDEPELDFLTNMFEAGNPDKQSSRGPTAATTARPRRSTSSS